jgi:hypothetical protein
MMISRTGYKITINYLGRYCTTTMVTDEGGEKEKEEPFMY